MTDSTNQVASAGQDRTFQVPTEVAALPLRDTVLFPNSFMPLAVARESSVTLIDEAIAGGKVIGVFTQKDPTSEEPGQEDLHPIGTLTHIHKMFKLPDGSLRLIVQGLARIRMERVTATKPYLRAEITEATEELREAEAIEIDALQRNIRTNFQQVVQLSPVLSEDLQRAGDQYRRARPACGLHRVEPQHRRHLGQTGPAGPGQRARPDGRTQPHPHQGTRGARTRVQDSVPGAVGSRQGPARVLPARAAEGDSEGTRRGGRAGQGNRRAA